MLFRGHQGRDFLRVCAVLVLIHISQQSRVFPHSDPPLPYMSETVGRESAWSNMYGGWIGPSSPTGPLHSHRRRTLELVLQTAVLRMTVSLHDSPCVILSADSQVLYM